MVDQIVAELSGAISTDDIGAVKKLIQAYVDMKIEQLYVGKEILPVQEVNGRHLQIVYPDLDYYVADKVTEYGKAPYKHITFKEIRDMLDKYQTAVLISDEVKLDQLENIVVRTNLDRAAEAMALAEDKEIFDAIKANVQQTFAATAAWNSDTADIAKDISVALEWIYDQRRIGSRDPVSIIMPPAIMPHLMRFTVGNTNTPLIEYIQDNYDVFNIKFLKSYEVGTDCYVVVNTNRVGTHYRLGNIEVEHEREAAVGDRYILTGRWKTVIFPDNQMIVKISGVKA